VPSPKYRELRRLVQLRDPRAAALTAQSNAVSTMALLLY